MSWCRHGVDALGHLVRKIKLHEQTLAMKLFCFLLKLLKNDYTDKLYVHYSNFYGYY